jgi:ribonuclease J
MASITFLGGVNDIGGNKFLVEDNGASIFLDFGLSFKVMFDYFRSFLQPKFCNILPHYKQLGMLPDKPGLYRADHLLHTGGVNEERGVDAVAISHAHIDHVGGIAFLRPDIPVYLSKGSRKIVEALETTGINSAYQFTKLRKDFSARRKITGPGWTKAKEEYIPRKIKALTTGRASSVGCMRLKPFEVDHSLPGSLGMIAYTSSGPVVYTGDVRFNGKNADKSWRFVNEASKAKPTVMLCEGARVHQRDVGTEMDVFERTLEAVLDAEGSLVLLNYPQRDLDRLLTFHEVAAASGRMLAVDTKQAYLLDLFNGDSYPTSSDKNIAVYLPQKGWGLIKSDVRKGLCEERFLEEAVNDLLPQDYLAWERRYLQHPNRVSSEDIKNNPDQFMLYMNFFDLNELLEIKPEQKTILIRSVTEPYNEDMEMDERVYLNWLKFFGITAEQIFQIHASGHANTEQVREMVNAIKPAMLIPIHTEQAPLF